MCILFRKGKNWYNGILWGFKTVPHFIETKSQFGYHCQVTKRARGLRRWSVGLTAAAQIGKQDRITNAWVEWHFHKFFISFRESGGQKWRYILQRIVRKTFPLPWISAETELQWLWPYALHKASKIDFNNTKFLWTKWKNMHAALK